VIGWVGRLAAIKDPDLFLDVVELTLQAHPDARFVIAGDGELRGPLEKQLTARNLGATVKMIGWQSDLSDFYADMDAVVMTSRHEGTPLTLLEAMASGKPFVSTDVGGIRDLMAGSAAFLDEGVQVFDNGILAGPSAASLAFGIRYLLERPQRAREIGSAGRRFASSTFAAGQSGRELESLYLKLLKQKSIG
jgi:glycosyltransferase involved in cell wall biosynthesis